MWNHGPWKKLVYVLRNKVYSSYWHAAHALLHMYVNYGSIDHAQLLFLFEMFLEFEIEATFTFKKMNISRIMLDVITFSSILDTSSHSGLLTQWWKIFNSIIGEWNILKNNTINIEWDNWSQYHVNNGRIFHGCSWASNRFYDITTMPILCVYTAYISLQLP